MADGLNSNFYVSSSMNLLFPPDETCGSHGDQRGVVPMLETGISVGYCRNRFNMNKNNHIELEVKMFNDSTGCLRGC